MISFESKGTFRKTDAFFSAMTSGAIFSALDQYAREGVAALAAATPVESGATAAGWGYEIRRSGSSVSITWTNTNVVSGLPIAILLQYGHGTGTGGYVRGRDYINPALAPVFDRIADNVWKAVKSA